MASARTVLRHLRNLDPYLMRFPRLQRARWFERLTVEALSHILYLPFYTSDTDDTSIPYRVVWEGSDTIGNRGAPPGRPDGIAYCYELYLTVEATLKSGANQCTQEYAQSLRHCEDFINESGAPQNRMYIVFVTRELYEDTYQSIRSRPRTGYNFIPLETRLVTKILETSVLAFTMKHIQLQRVMREIISALRRSGSLTDFRAVAENVVENWQKEVLRLEKGTFIGVKSYEAMLKIHRPAVAVSEILKSLLKHPFVGQYLNIIGEKLSVAEIETVLVEQSLGYRAGRTIRTDEPLFESVPCADFKGRGLRLIEAVERINK